MVKFPWTMGDLSVKWWVLGCHEMETSQWSFERDCQLILDRIGSNSIIEYYGFDYHHISHSFHWLASSIFIRFYQPPQILGDALVISSHMMLYDTYLYSIKDINGQLLEILIKISIYIYIYI